VYPSTVPDAPGTASCQTPPAAARCPRHRRTAAAPPDYGPTRLRMTKTQSGCVTPPRCHSRTHSHATCSALVVPADKHNHHPGTTRVNHKGRMKYAYVISRTVNLCTLSCLLHHLYKHSCHPISTRCRDPLRPPSRLPLSQECSLWTRMSTPPCERGRTLMSRRWVSNKLQSFVSGQGCVAKVFRAGIRQEEVLLTLDRCNSSLGYRTVSS
jgi:hypothetical protein